jgi:hypothetical protein
VIDGNVEEPLNLRRMQFHREDAIDARRRQRIRHELGGDRDARLIFALLPGIPKIGNHGRHARGRSPLGRINQEQQLHPVFGRRLGALHDEEVGAADRLLKAHVDLTVCKVANRQLPERCAVRFGNFAGQGWIRPSPEDCDGDVFV